MPLFFYSQQAFYVVIEKLLCQFEGLDELEDSLLAQDRGKFSWLDNHVEARDAMCVAMVGSDVVA